MSNLLEQRLCICCHEEQYHFDLPDGNVICSACAVAQEQNLQNKSTGSTGKPEPWARNPRHDFFLLTPFLNQCLTTWVEEKF